MLSRRSVAACDSGRISIVAVLMVALAFGVVVYGWLWLVQPHLDRGRFDHRMNDFIHAGFDYDQAEVPYRTGRVLVLSRVINRGHTRTLDAYHTEIHPAWERLAVGVRATRPEEVGTVCVFTYGRSVEQRQVTDLSKLRMEIYDWAARRHIGAHVFDVELPDGIDHTNFDPLDLRTAVSAWTVARAIEALPVRQPDATSEAHSPPR